MYCLRRLNWSYAFNVATLDDVLLTNRSAGSAVLGGAKRLLFSRPNRAVWVEWLGCCHECRSWIPDLTALMDVLLLVLGLFFVVEDEVGGWRIVSGGRSVWLCYFGCCRAVAVETRIDLYVVTFLAWASHQRERQLVQKFILHVIVFDLWLVGLFHLSERLRSNSRTLLTFERSVSGQVLHFSLNSVRNLSLRQEDSIRAVDWNNTAKCKILLLLDLVHRLIIIVVVVEINGANS